MIKLITQLQVVQKEARKENFDHNHLGQVQRQDPRKLLGLCWQDQERFRISARKTPWLDCIPKILISSP